MKKFFTPGGVIALLSGLLFVGQGSGFIGWPSNSFMINDFSWVYYGAGIAIIGGILIFRGRRR